MRPWQRLTISNNWNHLGACVIWNILVLNIKGENEQNSDNTWSIILDQSTTWSVVDWSCFVEYYFHPVLQKSFYCFLVVFRTMCLLVYLILFNTASSSARCTTHFKYTVFIKLWLVLNIVFFFQLYNVHSVVKYRFNHASFITMSWLV